MDEIEPRICTAEDIGSELFDSGILYICPPKDGHLMMSGTRATFPNTYFEFAIQA